MNAERSQQHSTFDSGVEVRGFRWGKLSLFHLKPLTCLEQPNSLGWSGERRESYVTVLR